MVARMKHLQFLDCLFLEKIDLSGPKNSLSTDTGGHRIESVHTE